MSSGSGSTSLVPNKPDFVCRMRPESRGSYPDRLSYSCGTAFAADGIIESSRPTEEPGRYCTRITFSTGMVNPEDVVRTFVDRTESDPYVEMMERGAVLHFSSDSYAAAQDCLLEYFYELMKIIQMRVAQAQD